MFSLNLYMSRLENLYQGSSEDIRLYFLSDIAFTFSYRYYFAAGLSRCSMFV